MGAKRRGAVDGGKNVGIRENVAECLKDRFGTAIFFEIVVNKSNFWRFLNHKLK